MIIIVFDWIVTAHECDINMYKSAKFLERNLWVNIRKIQQIKLLWNT